MPDQIKKTAFKKMQDGQLYTIHPQTDSDVVLIGQTSETLTERLATLNQNINSGNSTALSDAKVYTDTKLADLVGGASADLDTLKELAEALGNDKNFSTTVLTKISEKADAKHTHTTEDITNFPESMKNPNNVTITLNGGTSEGSNKFTYDGSETKTINITPASIGAATDTVFGAASSSANGTKGLVPAPQKGNQSAFLRGDGTWAVPTNTDTKVTNTLNNTAQAYITGTTTATTNTGSQVFDTEVYLGKTPGSFHARTLESETLNATTGTFDSVTVTNGITGNASTATKLATPVNISLNGAVEGTATSFDGSSDIAIPVTSVDASKLTGKIDISLLPHGALERLVPVKDEAARKALTITDVQNGDTVKVQDTGLMYFVVDDTKLGTDEYAKAFEEYTAGLASSVEWSGVQNKPETFTPSAHNHTVSDITNFPESMKNPNNVTITLNGGVTEGDDKFTYDGSSAKTIDITADSIGALSENGGTLNGTLMVTEALSVDGDISADGVHVSSITGTGNDGKVTIDGKLILNDDPSENLAAATKQYVDNTVAEKGGKMILSSTQPENLTENDMWLQEL